MKSLYFIILSLAIISCSYPKKEIQHPKGTDLIVFEAQYGSSENPDDHIYCELRHFQKGSEDSITAFYKRNHSIMGQVNFYYSDSVIMSNVDEFPFYMITKEEKQKVASNLPFYIIEY